MRTKRKTRVTPTQGRFIVALAKGKTLTEAALEAGYSSKNPGQSGYQALQEIAKKVLDILNRVGLDIAKLIEKHLIPLLNAQTTKFVTKDGQFTDWVDVPDHATQLQAIDVFLRLHGAYTTSKHTANDTAVYASSSRIPPGEDNDECGPTNT